MQREQILAKQQEFEVMRAKNCGRTKVMAGNGLRPESEANRKVKRNVLKTVNKNEVND